MNHAPTKSVPVALVLGLFFVSGASALVYEVVWSRMMMHVFGSTAIAVGTVLAAFMSGLALGGWFIGKAADRSASPLRLYASLEIGIALAALLSHTLLRLFNPVHLALHDLFGFSSFAFAVARFVLAFVLVMAPTILMGATLPVLSRLLLRDRWFAGIHLSTLYATNTFGAVSGVLLTGFFLIGRYGVHAPVYAAVAGNFLIGCTAWLAAALLPAAPTRAAPDVPPGDGPAAGDSAPTPTVLKLIAIGLGISGFTSFAYEIYWTRSLVFILGNSTYALTTMLSAFLTGIALGGYLIRFSFRRIRDQAAVFGWLQVLLGSISAIALPLLFSIADPTSLNHYLSQAADQAVSQIVLGFGVAFLVMLVPAMLIGATFPLVAHLGIDDLQRTGSAVGRTYAINTLGNVLGALLPGLFLIDWLGIQKGILLMAAVNVTLGLVVLGLRLLRPVRPPVWRLAVPAALLVALAVMSRAPLHFQFPADGETENSRTLFYREGPLATTKVYLDPASADKNMSVDRIVIGGTGYAFFKQLLLAHLPKLLVEDVSTELSVGLGSGILAGESAGHPGVEHITVVEIEPSVVAGARWFEKENHGVLDDPKVRIVVDDIGNFLRTTSGSYQVITADEKTADEYASNGFSYSLDYYQLLRRHLAPGGIVAQWVPTTLPPALYQMVLKTFSRGFPHVQLWYFLPAHERGPFNSILIGSNEPVVPDYDRISRRLEQDRTAFASLVPFGLTSPDAVLAHFVADGTTIRGAVEAASINSLDHPRYEFYYPWDFANEQNMKFIADHELIRRLKREAVPGLLASLQGGVPDPERLKQSFLAEAQYLSAFQSFLTGMPLANVYPLFDRTLALAPWNDSLRAQVYSLYAYLASAQPDPAMRNWLQRRADALYQSP